MTGPETLTGEQRATTSGVTAGSRRAAKGLPPRQAGRPAHATSGRRPPAPPGSPRRLSVANWPVSTRLAALFVMASLMGLIFGALRISESITTADGYARTVQLALLGRQITLLAQDMENERDLTAGVAAFSTLQGDATTAGAATQVLAQLNKNLSNDENAVQAAQRRTNHAAAATQKLAKAIGAGFPPSVRTKAANVVAQTEGLSGLRAEVQGQPPSQVIADYSNSIADLFTLNDEITITSGDAVLSDEVRAFTALSRAKDEASQQRAILYAALIESAFPDAGGGKPSAADPGGKPYNNVPGQQGLNQAGGIQALTTAQSLQFADLLAFESAAVPSRVSAYVRSVAGKQADVALMLDSIVTSVGKPQAVYQQPTKGVAPLGIRSTAAPSTWYSAMTGMITGMRSVENQMISAIVARSQSLREDAVEAAITTSVVTALAVIAVLLLTAFIARSLVNPLRRLQADALDIAAVRLPARVAAAASGTEPDEAKKEIEPIGVQSTDEIGRVARAFDQVHAEAVRLASTEAQLRGNLNAMFISLSRRSVPLIDRLARMIDALEQNEDDPDQLASLFSMDHLVTRMRRNSENLLVLAGEEPVRKWSEPVPLTDVARAAAAEIEQYGRVALTIQPGIMVSGHAAADIVHLLAELIENSTLFSPRDTQVRVSAQELETGGVLIEVRDEGVGVSANRLTDMNWRLDHPPDVDVSVSRHMGLFAVSRLAARHGIRARLRSGTPQGLSALVWLPGNLISRDHGATLGTRYRPGSVQAADTAPLTAAFLDARPSLPGRRDGRRRNGPLSRSGDQLALDNGQADQRPVWFTAKRPSSRPAPERGGARAGNGSTRNAGARNDSARNDSARNADAGTGNAGYAAAPAYAPAYAPADGSAGNAGYAAGDGYPAGGGYPGYAPNAAQWRGQPDGGWPDRGWPDQDSTPTPARWTPAGLPLRVPQANAFPSTAVGSATPDDWQAAAGWQEPAQQAAQATPGTTTGIVYDSVYDTAYEAGSGSAAALSASPDAGAPRRRSPEAARSRLSGFQLGSREATQAGQQRQAGRSPGRTPSAGEETSH